MVYHKCMKACHLDLAGRLQTSAPLLSTVYVVGSQLRIKKLFFDAQKCSLILIVILS